MEKEQVIKLASNTAKNALITGGCSDVGFGRKGDYNDFFNVKIGTAVKKYQIKSFTITA